MPDKTTQKIKNNNRLEKLTKNINVGWARFELAHCIPKLNLQLSDLTGFIYQPRTLKAASEINSNIKKQSDDVNKMSIKSSCFETKVMLHCIMVTHQTHKANSQKARTNKYVKTMKTGGHKKSRPINTVRYREICANVFERLKSRKHYS